MKHEVRTYQSALLVTFSAGVALHGADESPDSMIARADDTLYKAKLAGKNWVFPAG